MTLPDKLTAAEFERLKAQEQRMLNSGSWVPQAEDRLTSQVNAAAAESAAPDFMTAEQADVAEAQQSVMAETQFGRSVGIRPDYSQPPAKDPAEDEPKTINDLRKRQQDLYNDPSYDMPFEEWQDFTRWKKQNESEVGSFISGIPGMAESLGQLGVGLVKERAQQLYRATAGLDPIGAMATEVATFKEMGRKIGVGLTQLSDWVGGKVSDIVESGRRVGQVQQNVIQALRDNGQLTGDPLQDNTTIQKALEEAAAQGMYEPTQQQAEEDDEVGYQRYQRKKAYDREYSGITQFSIGGSRMSLPDVRETVTMPTLLPNTQQSKGVNAERQVFQPQEATSTVGAMAFSPENALPVGIGVLARARMLRRLASITGTPLKATETAMASIDDWMARTADRVTSKIPIVGDLPLRQRAYTLGAAGGVGAYLDATTDSPVIDVVAKPLIFAGAVLPTAKLFGGTLRRVGAGAGAGWQVIKEMDAGAVGSARAETAARMAASGKFNPRYSQYMERGAPGGVESTLRRVSNNPEMPETLRRIARSADNIGITQVARGIDDAVSSSVAAGIAATPFALAAPDSETAGGIVGGAVLLGGTLGTAGRVIGRRSARTDADIARMMVDVEMAGGDAGSLGALSYSGLDLLAAMQGITSGKVDFVPLRAQEYRANADVRASGGETVAGLHIEKAADGRAKVYVNMGHTAPIAGRVSIKPIQITRNGKAEDANVVRIKGEDGQSDFTVVPREYPLLVKSGDIVEPNARLARGLSPTHVMPHEIGHAILTSSILNGSIRDDLRNLVNQRYDTPGVEARGREYVTRIVDKDILAGAHDQLPDKLTQQEFDDIASGRRTMADVLKGKPVSDAQREAMITDRYNEMRERSIADGNNPDGLDVFRDEIVAETFSSLSDSLDFRRMRAGGPQVMESVLAATARVFETMGVKFDRSTGKLMDNPSVVFRDNPLMQDPIMRKRMQEHLRNYEAWMLGMEQAGAREQKGTQISVDGSAESARRSTHTKLRANDNGVLENDLIYIDQNGQAQWKPQKMLDDQEKGRSAQVGQLYDKNKILPPNSAEFGLRRAGAGRTVISGPTLPAKFDVLRWFPKHIREMARMLEAGREGGASHIFDYNTIGTGEGGRYRVINRGDVRAIIREGAFLGWEATKNGHLKAVVMDLNAFRSAAMRAINRGELGIFNNDMSQLQADLMVYLANHKNGLPGEATIGQQKRDMLNGLIGTGTAVQRDINPLYADLNPRGSVRSFRFDRINDITPTGRDGYHFDYDKLKHNRMPQALPREAMGMPDGGSVMETYLDREYNPNVLAEQAEREGYQLVYHGDRNQPDNSKYKPWKRAKMPLFTALEPEGADWYGDPRPLFVKTSKVASYEDMISAARKVGVKGRYGDRSGDVSIPEVKKHSQYDGANENDLLYIPRVREELRRQGFDAVRVWDQLERDEIEALIVIGSPGQIVDPLARPATVRTRGQAMPDVADAGDPPRRLIDMPQSALKVLHADSAELPKPSKKLTNATVALTLADVAERHNGGIITSSNITPEQKSDLMILGADEAEAALKASGKNAGNWYSVAIEAALGIAGVIYRELSDVVAARSHAVLAKEADPVRAGQFALRLPLAITSQNMTVKLNTRASNEQFNIFLKTGKFDPSIAYGEKAKSISGNLDLANVMIDELGSVLALEDFVSRQFTVRELEAEASKIAGRSIKIAGRKDDIVNGAAIFGPKIGQGFLQNLMGKFDPVTIDLWMRRTWGRWTGDVVGDGVTAQRLARLIDQSRKAGRKLPDSIKRLRTTMRSMGETKTGKAKKPELTMSEDVEARLEADTAFRKEVEAFAKEVNAEFQGMYKMMSDVMSPALAKKVQDAIERAERLPDQADAILSDVYNAVIREQSRVKQQLDKKWSALPLEKKKEIAAKQLPEWANVEPRDRAQFIKKTKPILKGDWLEMQHQAEGRTAKLDNPQKNIIKPAWANAAKSIVSELNPIDIPSDMDRRVITEVVNGIREELERRGYTVTNADVQAILWYPEKDLWAKLRGEEESILKQSYDDEFINIAEGLGLGREAREVAKQIRGY